MSLETDSQAMQWAPLQCKNRPEDALLYYHGLSSASELYLAVTDLCYLWEASLSREEVVDEAYNQNCSIDPSDSATQLQTLLLKLKQALVEGQNELGSLDDRLVLIVRTRLKLPAPLRMLKWTFQLQQRDNLRLADLVTFPLLREAALMRQQIQSLFQILKDKDHVLSKLLDKIDNSAIDLSLIFPGINGMKSRKQRIGISEASKHVPGMAAFDKSLWETEFARDHDISISGSVGFRSLLMGINANALGDLKTTDWIKSLRKLVKNTATTTLENSDTDDEIHEQDPSARMQHPDVRGLDSGSATESDFEDLADTPRRPRKGKLRLENHNSSPSLPAFQAKKSLLDSPAAAEKTSAAARKRKSADSDSHSDSDQGIGSTAKRTTKIGNKIGLLGGTRNTSAVSRSPTPSPVSSSTLTPSRKLGLLGGQKAASESASKSSASQRKQLAAPKDDEEKSGSETASSPPSSSVRRSVIFSKIDASPPKMQESEEIEESIEAKALRKREELKQSQAQAKSSLARKKARRF